MSKNSESINKKKKSKDIEVITGNGENLKISPVYDHIKVDKATKEIDERKEIVVPKTKNNITKPLD